VSRDGVVRYVEVAPPADLSPVLEALWQVEGTPGERIRVLADACTDLIALDEHASSVLFNGPMTVAEVSELRVPVTSGLRFRPGVVAEVVPNLRLDDVRDSEIRTLNPCPGEDATAGLVNLARCLLKAGRIRRNPVVEEVLAAFAEQGPGTRLSEVYRSAAASESTILRLFHEYVGLSPRQTLKVLRQNNVGRALRTRIGTIAELAAEHGYADQAHLTREFGALAGLPPGRFVKEINADGIVQDDRRPL
jgi:AraC-like DNA-binding protein